MGDLDPEEQFLRDARNGNLPGIQKLLISSAKELFKLNINCKGKSKSNFGWTPLHLACYFGHQNVVEELLKAGADVNVPNNVGDTALHKAAFTGRKEVVMLLLQYDACTTILNGMAQIPKDVTNNEEIKSMLEAAERTEERQLEEQFLEAAREGDVTTLTQMLNRIKPPDINCTDLLGNTALHCAAYRGQKHCALRLLRSGASPLAKNRNAQTPLDLASDAEMRQILLGGGQRGTARSVQMFQGPLWKSSRFLRWRHYWVVLQDGVLSWYPKQSDAEAGVRRQGCKVLTQAHCTVKERDNCFFTLKCFDDSIHHFKVDPKNDPEAVRKRWLDAMEEHSAYSTHYCSQEQGSDDEDDDAVTVAQLTESLQSAQACQQRLESEVSALLAMVKQDKLVHQLPPQVLQKMRDACSISADACTALRHSLALFSQHEGVKSQKLEQEVEKNKILSEALQTLATEHHELEQSVVKGSSPRSALSEDEFYDAVSESDSEHSLSGFETVASHSFEEEEERKRELVRPGGHQRNPAGMSQDAVSPHNAELQANGIGKHRTSLPAPMFSRNDFSIWSILRKCIGMELSKITMPVIFNEPLSFLQRLTEYMEHTYLIHQANTSNDSIERMKCVAAFAVSAVASQWERTGKPFNPLLGETYELVREDLGFRLISEQVSHHPPVSAFHAEGVQNDFVFHGSVYPKLKFWGKSVEAEPKGIITLELPKYGEAYTWTNPTCCVHNIIVGQLWIEQYGNVEVINHKTGEKCCLNFKPCGLFGKELHKVEGYILDKSKKKVCALYGKWTECLYTMDPVAFDAHRKKDRKATEEQKKVSKQGSAAEEMEEMPLPDTETVEVIPDSQLLWRISPRPANSAEMYSFTLFAMQLNELDKEIECVIPKTDCRLRPDIRAMENGDIDLASEEKKRLEEKQRAARKVRSKGDEEWKTRWFHQAPNPHNGGQDWIFSGGYWDRNYSELPDIY